MRRLLLEILGALLLAWACQALYGRWQDELGKRHQAERQIATMKRGEEIEHETHERELAIERSRAATERGVRRVCHTITLPVTPARTHEAAGADADHGLDGGRLAERLAGEILACRANAARLTGLQTFDRARAQ